MNKLEKEIKNNGEEFVNKDGKFRFLSGLTIVLVVYFAIHFLYADFKVLTFLNPVCRSIMQLCSQLLLQISSLIRNILL